MPAQLSLADQERDWRKAGRMAELGLSIVSEKRPRRMHDPERKQRESNALKVDERLQLARERREAYQKQLALREHSWLAREERAKNFYQKQLEERKRKLEEQRQKEERRRIAVEEKRKQRLKEERERYESVVRRTMAKSQKDKLGHCSQRTTNSAQSHKNVSCHSSTTQKAQVHCGKAVNRPARSVPSVSIRRTTNRELVAKGGFEAKDQQTQPQTTVEIHPRQDTNPQENAKPPTLGLQIRPHLRHALPKQDGLPPLLEEQEYELAPHFQQPETTTPQCLQRDLKQDVQLQLNPAMNPPHCAQTPNGPSQIGDRAQIRSPAWTTKPEEATRLLAEKRRQARLQREKEEEEQRQKVEMERRGIEELALRRAEKCARQEAEAVRLEEEQKKREEENRRQAENARRQLEEEKRLQQQREEEALQRVQAEQQRLERETRFQREEAERQERKKRLQEIMKRTRKTESEDKKAVSVKGTSSGENVKPAIRLPGPGKTSKLEMREEDDMLPTVAFKERRSFRPLSGLEEMQAHQQTEVI
ncbi:trichohyalin isoform X2 [Triplophysa rosa]|uniref:trichohyalin isoform X2 n=1 Tax=Triplophysa rosa TaxID=992332 RepID=UPI002545D471|nr:trichohyalin isoform X2 [Triplophysa rosa]